MMVYGVQIRTVLYIHSYMYTRAIQTQIYTVPYKNYAVLYKSYTVLFKSYKGTIWSYTVCRAMG